MDEKQLYIYKEKNMSDAEIAKLHGVHPNTVGNWRKKFGIARKSQNIYTPAIEHEIKKLASEGFTRHEISRRLNVHYAKVFKVISRHTEKSVA